MSDLHLVVFAQIQKCIGQHLVNVAFDKGFQTGKDESESMSKTTEYKFSKDLRSLKGFVEKAGGDSESLDDTITRSKNVVRGITKKARGRNDAAFAALYSIKKNLPSTCGEYENTNGSCQKEIVVGTLAAGLKNGFFGREIDDACA